MLWRPISISDHRNCHWGGQRGRVEERKRRVGGEQRRKKILVCSKTSGCSSQFARLLDGCHRGAAQRGQEVKEVAVQVLRFIENYETNALYMSSLGTYAAPGAKFNEI